MESPTHGPDADHLGHVELKPGAVLRSRYVLEQEIGRGGQCVVFRAKDLHRVTQDDPSGGRIALKLVHPLHRHDERAITRLAREFRQMQALAHPGIARVFDLDCDADIWFISMELIEGQPLSECMRRGVALGDAMRVIDCCCEALDYAHSKGIVHGDLKPSNVLRTSDGRVKLIDFGSVVSRNLGAEPEHSAAESSTPAYASPQVLAGMRAEVQDDVFSIASISYGLLSEGARPFGDKTSLEAHRARLCPAVIEGMPVEVFAVLVRSLAGDRLHRPAFAGEFYRDLLGTGPDMACAMRRTLRAGDVGRDVMRRLSFAGVAAAALCAAVLLLPAAQNLIAGTSNSVSAERMAPDVAAAIVPSAAASDTAASQPLTPVSFSPDATGNSDTSPFTLQGATRTSFAPGIVTFESTALIAGSAQSMVAIPIKRLQSTRGAAAFEWEIESGSARPNIDYEPVTPQVVSFRDGQSIRSLFIPLVRTAANGETRPPRSFTVSLRSVDGGARLGSVSRIKVTIVPQPIYSGIGDKLARK